MQKIRLLYASVARPNLTHAELRTLIRTSAEANAAAGITGVLFYADGRFMQALEGERSAVNRLYSRILLDARHTECEVFKCGEVATRAFAKWSMKLEGLEPGTARSESRRAMLKRFSGSEPFEPRKMTGVCAADFLRSVAHEERRLAAAP